MPLLRSMCYKKAFRDALWVEILRAVWGLGPEGSEGRASGVSAVCGAASVSAPLLGTQAESRAGKVTGRGKVWGQVGRKDTWLCG